MRGRSPHPSLKTRPTHTQRPWIRAEMSGFLEEIRERREYLVAERGRIGEPDGEVLIK